MCFNAQISFATYVIGMCGCYALYSQGYISEAIFYGWIIQMQLIEFFLWMTIHSRDTKTCIYPNTNKLITKIGILINHMEPIVFWLAIIFFSKKRLPTSVHQIMIFYIIISIIYTTAVFNIKECTTVSDISKPHLHWKWNQGPYHFLYYLLFLIVFIIVSIYGLDKGDINAILIIISFAISYLLYGDKHSIGAMWCFAGAFIPWILIILYNVL